MLRSEDDADLTLLWSSFFLALMLIVLVCNMLHRHARLLVEGVADRLGDRRHRLMDEQHATTARPPALRPTPPTDRRPAADTSGHDDDLTLPSYTEATSGGVKSS